MGRVSLACLRKSVEVSAVLAKGVRIGIVGEEMREVIRVRL